MAYGDDITEGIPYVLSNPAGSTTYALTGEAYDQWSAILYRSI
jgi:hypothetical protein